MAPAPSKPEGKAAAHDRAGEEGGHDALDTGLSAPRVWKGTWARSGASARGSRVAARRVLRPLGHPILVDVASLAVAAAIAGASDQTITRVGLGWGLLYVALTFLTLRFRGLYSFRLQFSPLDDFSRIVSATSTSALLLVTARLLADSVDGASAQAVRLWLGSTVCLVVGRAMMASALRRRWRAGHGQIRTVVVGGGEVEQAISRRLRERPELGLEAVGFVDDAERPGTLGRIGDLAGIVTQHRVRHVIMGFGSAPPDVLMRVMRECRSLGVSVSVVPRLFEEVSSRVAVEHLGGIPLMRSRAVDPRGWQFAVKYALDRVLALLLILLLSPFMLLIAAILLLSSGRPVFYRQKRVGLDGQDFEMLKFRTMRGDDASDGIQNAAWAATILGADESDTAEDRRTGIGRVLRASSLDELPQLFNVLRGDMSLVGPRPEQVPFVRGFAEQVYRYGDRHRVKCGVTGWAQIHGLRGDTSLAERVEWDNYYIENWTLWLDFKILFLTIPALGNGREAR